MGEEDKSLSSLHFNETPLDGIPKVVVPEGAAQIPTNEQDIPKPDAWNALGMEKKETWIDLIHKYLLANPGFEMRVQGKKITTSDLNFLKDMMGLTAREGVAFSHLVAELGLEDREIKALTFEYPEIERAIRIGRNLRMASVKKDLQSRASSNPSAAKALLQDKDFLGDVLSEEDDELASQDVDTKAEQALLALGITPCQYSQVKIVEGDLPSKDYRPKDTDMDFLGISPEEVLKFADQLKSKSFRQDTTESGPESPIELKLTGPLFGGP